MFASNDMIYSMKNGNIHSGGMNVKSILLNAGHPIGYGKKGGTIENILGDLVVPVGLIYLQEHLNKRTNNDTPITLKNTPISDSLYDKLLGIKEPNNSKKKTRKKYINNNKKTRKN